MTKPRPSSGSVPPRLPPHTADSLAGAGRIDALDGFRALAVTVVVVYHYLYFWISASKGTDLLANDDAFARLPLVSIGFLGVHLFFVVSGFVVLLTLEKSKSLRQFLTNRVIRLWPPLILFGTLTFVIVNAWGPPSLRVGVWEYLLSIILLPPHHVGALVGADGWTWLDGVYWSLWVEVRFYILVGAMYFFRPASILSLWMGYEVATMGLGIAAAYDLGGRPIDLLEGFLFQPYVPYFSFGMAAYMVRAGRGSRRVHLLALLAVCHLALLWLLRIDSPQFRINGFAQYLFGDIAILVLFYFFAWRNLVASFFSSAPVVRMGRASYGIYLLHQNVGVTILALPLFAGTFPGLLAASLTFLGVILIAVASYEHFEKPLQSWLRRRLMGARHDAEPATAPAGPAE